MRNPTRPSCVTMMNGSVSNYSNKEVVSITASVRVSIVVSILAISKGGK